MERTAGNMLKVLWFQVTTSDPTYKGMTYDYHYNLARMDFIIGDSHISFLLKGDYKYTQKPSILLDKAISSGEVEIIQVSITKIVTG